MRKVILALARSSLVAAFCCSVSFAQTAETSRAGSVTRSNGTDSRLPQSPRELLKRGKDLYLQGHHAKALQALEQVPSDADLSEADLAQLEKLLEAARKKVDSLPGRNQVTTRAQSPDPFGASDNGASEMMATLKKEARRLADAPAPDRKAAAVKWVSIARSAFNQGDVDDAEQIAQLAGQIQAPFKATEDSPEKVLAEIQEARKQDAAWRNDKSSPQAKRNRSNYLLRRAQQMGQQGDTESALRFISEAERIQVTPGVLDLKPAQVRQQLEGVAGTAGQTQSRTQATANRGGRNSGIEQVGFEEAAGSGAVDSPEAMRVKADQALRQAQLAQKQGHLKDAWRLAAMAQKLEVEGGLKYRAGEERPSQYMAKLMQQMPDDPASLAIMERELAQSKTAGNDDVEFAEAMMASAKEDMQKGDVQTAREKIEHVIDLKIAPGKLGERPEDLLALLDGKPGATASRTKSRGQTSPRGTANANKAKALQLMNEAKAAMAAGDLELARAKTLAANQTKAAFDVLEETPHQLMAQIDEAAMGSKGDGKMLADAEENPFGDETAPRTAARTGSRTGSRSSGLPNAGQKQRATELLELSRAELKAGRLADAKRLALEANKISAVYQLFEDRPELVLADIELAEASGPTGPGTGRRASLDQDAAELAQIQVAPETREPDLAKRQAVMLLKQARADLKAGRLKEAEEKALHAEKLDATYSEFEDKPTMVLKEVERANSLAATGAVIDASGTSENPFHSAASDGALAQASGVEASVIDPNGATAADLIRDGKVAMRRGDREAAYHLFLQAYKSGEQMHPRTKQQLEEFLLQLSPKKNSNIQQAGGSSEEPAFGDANAEPTTETAEGEAPSKLDRVDQQLAVKLDAVRTQVMNQIFRADRAREKDPAEALKILDKAQLELENSDLSKEQVAPLLRSVTRARELAQGSMLEQKSNLDQKAHNAKVKEQNRGGMQTQIRIEQEFADLVQQFNDLLKQRRYAEAELIAKKAKELDPDNPSAEIMKWKAKFAMRNASNEELKDRKEEGVWGAFDSVEWSAIPFDDRNPIVYAKNWTELSNRRKGKYGPDNRTKTEEEKRIEKSLSRQVSMHFDNEPLQSVINKLAVDSNINFRLDPQGLEEVQVDSNTPITIQVDGIQMKSALNLILEPLHLGYAIRDEVLKITSIDRQKGDLEVRVYNVADLVIPIPNFANPAPLGSLNAGMTPGIGGAAPFSVAAKQQRPSGQAFAQVQDGFGAAPASAGTSGVIGERRVPEGMRRASQADFDSLMELVVNTVEPNSWDEVGGQASVRPFETTLSLVIRQTQQAHEEIQDLLAQLRRLQDLQVSIEVRFVTVSDKFFERIGVDFDFNVQGTAPVNNINSQFGDFLPPFGGGRTYTNAGATNGSTVATGSTTTGSTTSGTTTSGTTTSGTSSSGANSGTGSAPFAPGPPRDLTRRGDYPKLGTIVGLERQLQFSNDLQIPFRQGSFDVGIPDFGSFKPDAGLSMGFAILSDIETFFFIQAAQGDSRSNILFAPKVTLFNGQLAQVEDNLRRPFVVGQTPVVGAFTVAFAPNVQIFTEGVTLLVTAVVSADRRYVRLSLVPDFRSITDVFTFTFSGTGSGVGGNTGGSNTNFGGNSGTNIGSSGGGGVGSGGTTIGGNSGTTGGSTTSGTTTSGTGGTSGGSVTGGTTNIGSSQPATQTVQQPVQEVISIQTSVSVPDGGTVLLGGIKRLKEGRNMAGVPILNKIPYISRLFKNSGVGRETDSLMMMVTPRIIIQEEEEELLGVPL